MILTEPTTPLVFHAQPGGTFSFVGCFMHQYPKQILTIAQQVQSYIDAGMVITSRADVEKAFKEVQAVTHCSTGCGGCYEKVLDTIADLMN